MKRIKLKKRRNKLRIRRKLVLTSTLVLFLVIGIGYSVLSVNLNILGNITVRKHYGKTLYEVLEREAAIGTYAKEYTGDHHDSFTEEPSKKIYYWYGSNATNGTAILDMNNVIFANHCWQMIRTTDTGGVKMIYNGEAVDNQCLSTRGTHVGYAFRTSQNLASNYWYGTDYTYDSTAKTFKVSGTTEQTTWNATTGPGLIGKYTCKLTDINGTCSTLYLVESKSYYNTSSAYVIPLNSNSNYSQFGTLQFNASYDSPTYVGYMYGDVYAYSTTNVTTSQSFTTTQTVLSTMIYAGFIGYGDDVIYDNSTGKYTLVNFTRTEPDNLTGIYIGDYDNNPISSVVYVVNQPLDSSLYYSITLANGNLLSSYEPILFGDSITDNGNGTYTINNPTNVTLSDWYTNYATYVNKYTCNDSSTTCANPRYTTATSSTNYTYMNAGEKIMIGKTRSGLTLTDTLLVRKDELVINSSNYSDYKYTCNTDSATCTESTLRMISGYSTTGYNYAPNHYYGSSVTWDGTNYTLVDPIEIENYNNMNNISTHHYMCVTNGLKTCATVAYVYYYTGSGTMYYITLRDGVTTVGKALEDMLTKNTTNSTMKSGVDAWYKHYLLEDYDDYIEDTIFCNDRSIRALNGWNPDGGMTNTYLQFKEYNVTSDLSCTNTTDQFSVSNNNAKLTYKVGLMSSPEMNILNNNNARKTGQYYWLASPYYFSSISAYGRGVSTNGSMSYAYVGSNSGVRPAVSLTPGIEYSDGDGSKDDPYIVNTFQDDDWNTIVNNVRNGNTANYQLGDTKEVDMGSYGIHTLRIANKSTPSECNNSDFSETACGFVLEFADIIDRQNTNSTVTNVGGWPATEMRTYVNSNIYNALPTDLKNGIIDTRVISGHGSSDSNNFTSTDKLYLQTLKEINGVNVLDTAADQTRQLDYYSNLGIHGSNILVARKLNNNDAQFRLRNARSDSSTSFYALGSDGMWFSNSSTELIGVSPAFRIG